MAKPSGRDIVDRWQRAVGKDFDVLRELAHPEFVVEWPQSGERVRGWEKLREILQRYPDIEAGEIGTEKVRGIAGSTDEWVMTPSFTPLQIVGTGDTYTVESVGKYPDGSTWFVVSIITLKDDKVFRDTTYFAPPFDAPEWRAELVERME
jgi:hypothetical protein